MGVVENTIPVQRSRERANIYQKKEGEAFIITEDFSSKPLLSKLV